MPPPSLIDSFTFNPHVVCLNFSVCLSGTNTHTQIPRHVLSRAGYRTSDRQAERNFTRKGSDFGRVKHVVSTVTGRFLLVTNNP